MKQKYNSILKFLIIFIAFYATIALADSITDARFIEDQKKYNLLLADSSTKKWAGIKFSLGDSIAKQDIQRKHQWKNSVYAVLNFRGALSSDFNFGGNVFVFTEFGNTIYSKHDYQPYQGIPYNLGGSTGVQTSKKRTFDYFTSWTEWNLEILTLKLGVDYLSLGPSRRNKLMLAGDEKIYRPYINQNSNYRAHRFWGEDSVMLSQRAPFSYIGFSMGVSWIEYQQYVAKLKHQKDKNKFFHTHRLELKLPFKTTIGINESVVYGDAISDSESIQDSSTRSLDALYAIPFLPYFFAEHYNGDQDNILLSLDFENSYLNHWTFYGELLLDDMKNPPKGFTDDSWWGNKWASSIGLEYQVELSKHNFKWNLEYTHIEPWVYTHHLGVSHSYQHYGKNLGSSLGPNSQEIYSSIAWLCPKK